MPADGPKGPHRLLRWIASLLVRGPDGDFVRDDLDELFERDLARGMSRLRAHGRWAVNVIASAASTWRFARRAAGAGRVSRLDVQLGLRMLVKYPGLAVVGVLAMSLGIGLGAAYLEIVHDLVSPELPLEEGDRIVGFELWDAQASTTTTPVLHDFLQWRESLRTVEDVGAFRTVERNLIPGPGGLAEPVEVVAISPAAFRVARVPPARGRALVEADARPGAPPVVVLGHDLWRTRFGADAAAVGRSVRVGGTEATVVGVMPEGFAFPMNHALWVPLRPAELVEGPPAPRQGPPVEVFARLAPGATLEEARTEVAALGGRTAADLPGTHAHLRPRVVPYTQLFFGGGGASGLYWFQIVFVALLVLVAANVATLVFARTATRGPEIAVRTALGASRGRIVGQLFVEALVLSSAAAVVALLVVRWLTGELMGLFWSALGGAPFWWDPGLASTTVAFAVGLAVAGAVVVGVPPALRATRRDVRSALGRAGAGGAPLRLGRLWTATLVAQVACSVALLPAGVTVVWQWAQTEAEDPGFPVAEYLGARLEAERVAPSAGAGSDAAPALRFRATLAELERRLEAEPEVRAVTFASALPGMNHPSRVVEVEGMVLERPAELRVGAQLTDAEGRPVSGPEAEVAFVAPDFFDALGAPLIAGRAFDRGDDDSVARPAVVNRAFAERILGGRNALGRRVRYATRRGEEEEAPWFEIVGVLEDVATDRQGLSPGLPPALYLPLGPGALTEDGRHRVRIALHVQGSPGAFAPRLRGIATAVDPSLRLHDPLPLDDPPALERGLRVVNELLAATLALVALAALLVSASGTYALMSFTVARRTREIGVRSALGAQPARLLRGIFSRAASSLLVGVGLGTVVWVGLLAWAQSVQPGGAGDARAAGVLAVVAAIVLATGLVACGIPARRALRIEPTEALRGE